jgi:hypothetical protein
MIRLITLRIGTSRRLVVPESEWHEIEAKRERAWRGNKKEKTDIVCSREQLYGYSHEILHSPTNRQFEGLAFTDF